MADESRTPAVGHWEQLNRCPDCGADMRRLPQVGEQIGLYYECDRHGRFRYCWDRDALERVPDRETRQ